MTRPLVITALLAASCLGPGATTGSLSGGLGSTSSSSSSSGADAGTSTADTTSAATSSSTTSTSSDGTSSTATSAPDRMDLPRDPDLGPFPGPPAWCSTRKVDFVFQISSSPYIEPYLDNLQQSLDGWIDAIETLFPDFDVHIVVPNTTDSWGNPYKCLCPEDLGCDAIEEPNYPCWAAPGDKCDNTLGAGVVFPAGKGASNKLCEIPDGRRYLITGDAKLKDTFSCVAQVGHSGGGAQGETVMTIVKPYISAPGACNAGFLRDDSLLFITIVEYGNDWSMYNPPSWADVVQYWREDPESVFILGVLSDFHTNLEDFLGYIEHHHQIDIAEPDYVQGFSDAATMALKLCEPPPK